MESPLHFYSPGSAVSTTSHGLPHWHQQEATFFATFRLADAVPDDALRAFRVQREEWIEMHPPRPWPPDLEREFNRRFTGRFERWLDRGYGSCLLRNSGNAKIVEDTLRHFEGERSRLHAWVVMPNHVHVLASLVGDVTIAQLMKFWKGFTARQINERGGKSGPLWQKNYFDRLIRDWDHFGKCVQYIRRNPDKAGLKKGEYLQGESDLARRM